MLGSWAMHPKSERQAEDKWDGRTPLQCFAAGKVYTVRVDGFNDLQIFDMRKRIAGGDCKASPFKPTAG
jgi:hypothetical protein